MCPNVPESGAITPAPRDSNGSAPARKMGPPRQVREFSLREVAELPNPAHSPAQGYSSGSGNLSAERT